MRVRYWLPAAALLGLGLLTYFCSYAYQFAGLTLCAIAVVFAVFGLAEALKPRLPRTAKWTKRILTGGLALVLLLAVGTGIRLGISMQGADDPEADFVVVLGAGVNGTAPSQSLRERLEAALTYLERYPDAILILSGGQGDQEHITEAECMYRWLMERGADPTRLRKEENATSTEENITFSLALIEAEFGMRPKTLGVISAEYHLLRASLLAKKAGVETVCFPSRTQNRLFFCTMFLREIAGVWYTLVFE